MQRTATVQQGTQPEPLRAAVIGVGYLGRFHAEKYAQLDGVDLVAVVDVNHLSARAVGQKLGVRAVTDYHEILPEVDLVSIVTPASTHHRITRDCLLAGLDVLVEKPIALSVADADDMVQLARDRACVLQVGHLERFNPIARALFDSIEDPRFIEGDRLAPFKPRATDTDVLLDLMIHDLDLVLRLVPGRIQKLQAFGTPVLTDALDIANARLHFDNGCIVDLTASRVSTKAERKLRFFQRSGYVSADFGARTLTEVRVQRPADGPPRVEPMQQQFDGDGLRDEIRAFVDTVRSRCLPDVTGEDGREALEAALRVRREVEANPLV